MAATSPDELQPVDELRTEYRDALLKVQKEVALEWSASKPWNVDAPEPKVPAAAADGDGEAGEEGVQDKFMVTFPYPYMNGRLHLGHAFTLGKADFMVGYHRLRGKRTLYPFGFHATGMPIVACADKVKREMAAHNFPPFPAPSAEELEARKQATILRKAQAVDIEKIALEKKKKQTDRTPKKGKKSTGADPLAFKSKKTKLLQKGSASKAQWEIIRSMDVSDEDLEKFGDPQFWLKYFPPLSQKDVTDFGCKVDWRRSMITTPVNPYYDSFVRWQFLKLKEKNLVRFGKRFTIWSPADDQACMGQDRSEGENVGVQEYTLIKLKAVGNLPQPLEQLASQGKEIYFAAATLRPETMYGQTNCWVLPSGKYGAFEINDKEVFVVSHRAGRNLAFQGNSVTWGKPNCLCDVTGQELIGTKLSPPFRDDGECIYTLPMLTIDMEKGTGVVTCVPSDSPADWRTLQDLRENTKLLEEYKVQDEWVPKDLIEILEVPEYGKRTAEKLCLDMKIKSQKDTVKLEAAKNEAYKRGFNSGIMLVGEFKGVPVKDAKPKVQQKLLDMNLAVMYGEPDGKAVSRSGDECVVALADQWYLAYGDPEWRKVCDQVLADMRCYGQEAETRADFESFLDWLENWPCSRTYGLGTTMPWAKEFLICSLSDSTIYMAYYTVAHLLHEGSLDGSTQGKANVQASQMTPEVWDYIFCMRDDVPETDIPLASLQMMRNEYSYWYPCDCRISGKDLIKNHLTFSMYNHAALFPKEKWPKGVRCNGFLNLNYKKMAKSTGNFITLSDAIEKYSSDAARLTLASAGDALKVANFVHSDALSSIDRLHKLLVQLDDMAKISPIEGVAKLEFTNFNDRAFVAEIAAAVQTAEIHYEESNFRAVFTNALVPLWNAMDRYKTAAEALKQENPGLVRLWYETLVLLISPFCPFTTYYIWKKLGHEKPIYDAAWPVFPPCDQGVLTALKWSNDLLELLRHKLALEVRQKKCTTAKVKELRILLSKEFPPEAAAVYGVLNTLFAENGDKLPDMRKISQTLAKHPLFTGKANKKRLGMQMKMVKELQTRVETEGAAALELDSALNEMDTVKQVMEFYAYSLKVPKVTVHYADEIAEDKSVAIRRKIMMKTVKPVFCEILFLED